jgi:Glyoxalase-like domain
MIAPMPHLDHISLAGRQTTFEELGFRVTPTRGTTDHARILLDRFYFEVTPPRQRQVEIGARGWFLRPADPAQLADTLRGAGLEADGPRPYQAEDGRWLDVSIPERTSPAFPIFTKRTDEPEDAWPPPLIHAHPNGAATLAAIHLQLRDPAPLLHLFEVLGVPSVGPATFELAGKVRVVVQPAAGNTDGIVAAIIERTGASPWRLETKPLDDLS